MGIGNRAAIAGEIKDSIFIRDVTESELRFVHQLNQNEKPHVSDLSLMDLEILYGQAHYFKVAMLDHKLAGFLIAMDESSDYQSINYLYFKERYSSFFYIDRIAIAEPYKGQGLGQKFYHDASKFAAPHTKLMACEVNIRPSNEASMRFHDKYGFKEVGQQDTEEGKKRVSLLIKKL